MAVISEKDRKQIVNSVDKTQTPERPDVTYWMNLGDLTQEILLDVSAVYLQVYNFAVEEIETVPDLDVVKHAIVSGEGWYPFTPVGGFKPQIEVIRIRPDGDVTEPDDILIKFNSSRVRGYAKEAFQNGVHGYLHDFLGVSKPISQALGHHRTYE